MLMLHVHCDKTFNGVYKYDIVQELQDLTESYSIDSTVVY